MAKKVAEIEKVEKNDRLAKPGTKVELVKGEFWRDDLSGISLERGFYKLADKDELKNPDVARTGYVKLEVEKAPVATLPSGKDLSRVEKALKIGILRIFDPANPAVYREFKRDFQMAKHTAEGSDDLKYLKEKDEKINGLLKMSLKTFEETVQKIKNEDMLVSIFNAEYEGRNPTSGVRKPYIDILKKYMKTKREKLILSNIQVTDDEVITVEKP